MLSIRLTRTGKTHAPHYRIVVQEKRSKLNGKSVDIIGHYHPASPDKLLVIDKEKAAKWIGLGAQASDTVTNLLVKEGILDASKKVHHFYTPAKKEVAEAAPVAEEPVAAEAAAEEPEAVANEEAPAVEEEIAATEEVSEPAAEEEAAAPETAE
jgi:small subunit ribosomal protein S16